MLVWRFVSGRRVQREVRGIRDAGRGFR